MTTAIYSTGVVIAWVVLSVAAPALTGPLLMLFIAALLAPYCLPTRR